MKRFFIILPILFVVLIAVPLHIFAQTVTPTPTPSSNTDVSGTSDIADCANNNVSIADCPDYLQSKLDNLQGQANTISNTIAVMSDKIQLTESQIAVTKAKIVSITNDINASQTQINQLNGSLKDLTKLLYARIVATYETDNVSPVTVIASSNSLQNYMTSSSYIQLVQEHDKKLIYDMQASQNSYENVKQIRESQKTQVETLNTELQQQNTQLDQQKQQQQSLLSQVQGNLADVEREHSQALAELAGFSNFVQNAGGSSILSGQTSCDSWGCYYNQRDSQWGNTLINGQSGYSMAGYGCLITSIAMVATHMGHTNVTPGDIATSSSNNFAYDTAMLKYSISVNGLNISRSGTSSLDSALQNGPVIVGIYAYGGTHFVVLKSGSGGNYVMDDPYISNGHDINFTDHYSVSSIFEMDTLSM